MVGVAGAQAAAGRMFPRGLVGLVGCDHVELIASTYPGGK